jgi:hypothetical protein
MTCLTYYLSLDTKHEHEQPVGEGLNRALGSYTCGWNRKEFAKITVTQIRRAAKNFNLACTRHFPKRHIQPHSRKGARVNYCLGGGLPGSVRYRSTVYQGSNQGRRRTTSSSIFGFVFPCIRDKSKKCRLSCVPRNHSVRQQKVLDGQICPSTQSR